MQSDFLQLSCIPGSRSHDPGQVEYAHWQGFFSDMLQKILFKNIKQVLAYLEKFEYMSYNYRTLGLPVSPDSWSLGIKGIIVWQRFCEPARLRIAYCPSVFRAPCSVFLMKAVNSVLLMGI